MSEVIAGVNVPDTEAVAESTRLLQKTVSPLLYHHCRRVYLFGQMHARSLGIEPDAELLEVDGADHAYKFLIEHSDVVEHFVPGYRRPTSVEQVIGAAWSS